MSLQPLQYPVGRRWARTRAGWLLAGLIILVSAVAIAFAAFTLLLTEHLRATSLRQNQTKAIYLAQAGVMYGLYSFRNGPGVQQRAYDVDAPTLVPGPNHDAFILSGTQADFLLVNWKAPITFTSPVTFCGSGRGRLQGWRVRNVLASGETPLVITKINVQSDAGSSERVLRIDLNGPTQDWAAPGCSPCTASCTGVALGADIDLTSTVPEANRTVNPGAAGRWDANRVWFTSSMASKAKIDLLFTLKDDPVRVRFTHYEPALANRTADFTVKSIGELRAGQFPFVARRRLQADYRICASVTAESQCDAETGERTQRGRLLSYQELATTSP